MSMSNAGPPATATGMETVVAVALGALAAVFLGAFVVLLVICRRQRCYYVSSTADGSCRREGVVACLGRIPTILSRFQNQKDSAELSSDLLEGENITGLGLDAWESEEWLAGAERYRD